MTISVRAKVTVKLSVELSDRWGTDCTVEQVHKQAKESAMGKVARLIEDAPGISIEISDVTAILVRKAD